MLISKLEKLKIIHPPDWLSCNTHYLALTGSHAVGVATEHSDYDYVGFCTPRKNVLFKHLDGIIQGFGDQGQNFEQWIEQNIIHDDKEYDFRVMNIVKFFELCRKNNPDILSVLFVPRENIVHITSTGEIVRNNRHKFLSKECYFRFKGFAFSMINKSEKEEPTGNRKILRDKFGYDPKFLSNCVRLCYEAQMILEECDIDLQRYKEHISAVRNGLIGFQETKKWVAEKEIQLEKLYTNSKLPVQANEKELKDILINCLEHHFGSLEKAITVQTDEAEILRKIKELVKSY